MFEKVNGSKNWCIRALSHLYLLFRTIKHTLIYVFCPRKIIYIYRHVYTCLLWRFLVPFTPLNQLNYELLFFLNNFFFSGIFLILRCIYVDNFPLFGAISLKLGRGTVVAVFCLSVHLPVILINFSFVSCIWSTSSLSEFSPVAIKLSVCPSICLYVRLTVHIYVIS